LQCPVSWFGILAGMVTFALVASSQMLGIGGPIPQNILGIHSRVAVSESTEPSM